MKEAFVIMQIGNSELDKLYDTAIVPALVSCGVQPRRVDKHNSGGLLKSEIVGFIQSADIIVADLSNSRPNCYLEVGYAMGLDKFRQLILTAREDHNPDNPEYDAANAKVHFDLSGYEILFWSADAMDAFREQLSKRIRRRLAILAPSRVPASPPWNADWVSSQRQIALSGLASDGRKSYMEVLTAVVDSKLNVSQGELLAQAESAQVHTFGWPIGIVLQPEGLRPVPKVDGIQAEVRAPRPGTVGSYDYWVLQKDGTFYFLESLIEDRRQPGAVFFDTRIIRITEALLHTARLYSRLGVPPDAEVWVSVRHGGLKDHELSASSDRYDPPGGYSSVDEVAEDLHTTLSGIESHLTELVEQLTAPLLVVFGYFKVGSAVYEDIVSRFVNRGVS